MMNKGKKGGMKLNKQFACIFGGLLMACAMVGSSQAGTLYSYTDPAYGITYSLDFTGGTGNTLSFSGPDTLNLYATAFTFKFSGNDTWTLSNLLPTSINGDTWAVGTATTKVLTGGTYKDLLEANRVGFFNVDAATGGILTNIDSIAINEGFGTSFSFDLAQTAINGLDSLGDSFAFKVLYITNNGEEAVFKGWLSQELTTRVPEAGALMLFGMGLIGLVGYRRVRRMQ